MDHDLPLNIVITEIFLSKAAVEEGVSADEGQTNGIFKAVPVS